jgi:hypothetical protein
MHWRIEELKPEYRAFSRNRLHNQDSSGVIMTSQAVNLEVTASVPIDCDFWSEDDGWKGLCKSLSVTVRGSSFEDAKKTWQLNYKRISKESCVSIPREVRGELPEPSKHFWDFLQLERWMATSLPGTEFSEAKNEVLGRMVGNSSRTAAPTSTIRLDAQCDRIVREGRAAVRV